MITRPESITVKVHGREFNIVTTNEREPLYISTLAQYVDEAMTQVAESTQIVDTSQLAVMAALDITDELFRLRDRKEEHGSRTGKAITQLIDRLDQAINQRDLKVK
jgi:cell division protein ZapA